MPTYLLHCRQPGCWSAGGSSLYVKFEKWSKECLCAILSNRMHHRKEVAESLVKITASIVP